MTPTNGLGVSLLFCGATFTLIPPQGVGRIVGSEKSGPRILLPLPFLARLRRLGDGICRLADASLRAKHIPVHLKEAIIHPSPPFFL